MIRRTKKPRDLKKPGTLKILILKKKMIVFIISHPTTISDRKTMKVKNIFNYVARKEVGDRSNRPVEIVENCGDAPRYKGESFYWTTVGGTRIEYPSAYQKKGWNNMVYNRSTLRIVVGRQWCVNKIREKYSHLVLSHVKG
jgi:hypothetical protein